MGLFMPIIVDKKQKRRDIALSCRELLLERGISDITVSQIAETAGVGKGTIYEYFSGKEDIVFEIIASFIDEHRKNLEKIASTDICTKEKISQFYFLFFDDEVYRQQLRVYREFIAISVTNPTEQTIAFSQSYHDIFNSISERIINDAIARGELRQTASTIIPHLAIYHTGLIVEEAKRGIDGKQEIDELLDALFELLEIKND